MILCEHIHIFFYVFSLTFAPNIRSILSICWVRKKEKNRSSSEHDNNDDNQKFGQLSRSNTRAPELILRSKREKSRERDKEWPMVRRNQIEMNIIHFGHMSQFQSLTICDLKSTVLTHRSRSEWSIINSQTTEIYLYFRDYGYYL